MPVPTSIDELSQTPGDNPPDGDTDSPNTLDDHQRQMYAFIKELADRDSDFMLTVLAAADAAAARATLGAGDLEKDGSVAMTGPLTLSGDAVAALDAVPKQQLDAAVVGTLIGYQIFTSSGTYTKATNNPSFVVVEVQGGGGGGGGSSVTNSVAGGGGAGGYGMKRIAAASLLSSETVTVGAGGSASSVGSDGGAGGTSSFGAHISCTGGAGGAGATSLASRAGGAGGISTGGDINCTGEVGGRSIQNATNGYSSTGEGGASRFGGNGAAVTGNANSPGGNAVANSGSGGGGSSAGAGGQLGSVGGSGIVIVWEYK